MTNPTFNPYAKEHVYRDIPLLDNEFDTLDDLRPSSFYKVNAF